MSWSTPSNVGTAANAVSTNSVNIAYSSANAGDIILCAVHGGPAANTVIVSDVGFSVAASRNTNETTYLFAKTALGTESGSFTATFSGNGDIWGQCATFPGGSTTVHASNSTGGGNGGGLPYAALPITQPQCLIIVLGGKPGNASGWSTSPFNAKIAEPHEANLCMVWWYTIQTTAANLTAGVMSASTDVTLPRNSVSVAILPAASAFVPQPPLNNGGMVVQICQ